MQQSYDMVGTALIARLKSDLETMKNEKSFFPVEAKTQMWIDIRNNDMLINASKAGSILFNVNTGTSKRVEMGKTLGLIKEEINDFAQRLIDRGTQAEPLIARALCSMLIFACSVTPGFSFAIIHSPGIFCYHFDTKPLSYIPVIKKVLPNTMGASPDSILTLSYKRTTPLEGALTNLDKEYKIVNAVVEYKFRASGKEFPVAMDLSHFIQVVMQMMATKFNFGIYIAQKPEDGNTFYQCRLFKKVDKVWGEMNQALTRAYEHITRYYHDCEEKTAWPRETSQVFEHYEKMLIYAYDGYELYEFVMNTVKLIDHESSMVIKIPKPVLIKKPKSEVSVSSSSSIELPPTPEFRDIVYSPVLSFEDSEEQTPMHAVVTNEKKREPPQEKKTAKTKRQRKRTKTKRQRKRTNNS